VAEGAPDMNELLQNAGLIKVAEDKILVTEIRGPLEDGWKAKVQGSPSKCSRQLRACRRNRPVRLAAQG
jgi:hypothetical protein